MIFREKIYLLTFLGALELMIPTLRAEAPIVEVSRQFQDQNLYHKSLFSISPLHSTNCAVTVVCGILELEKVPDYSNDRVMQELWATSTDIDGAPKSLEWIGNLLRHSSYNVVGVEGLDIPKMIELAQSKNVEFILHHVGEEFPEGHFTIINKNYSGDKVGFLDFPSTKIYFARDWDKTVPQGLKKYIVSYTGQVLMVGKNQSDIDNVVNEIKVMPRAVSENTKTKFEPSNQEFEKVKEKFSTSLTESDIRLVQKTTPISSVTKKNVTTVVNVKGECGCFKSYAVENDSNGNLTLLLYFKKERLPKSLQTRLIVEMEYNGENFTEIYPVYFSENDVM